MSGDGAGDDGTVGNGAGGEGESDFGEAEGAVGDDGDRPAPTLSPAVRSSLLWGAVGGLAFLVLIQGYELLSDEAVSLGVKVGVTLVVTVVAIASTRLAHGRLPSDP